MPETDRDRVTAQGKDLSASEPRRDYAKFHGLAGNMQRCQIICLLLHLLCVALPCAEADLNQVQQATPMYTDAQMLLCNRDHLMSTQTRCATGSWWGPDAVGGDHLVVSARFVPRLACSSKC